MPDLVLQGLVDVGIASVATPLQGLEMRLWTQLELGLLSLTTGDVQTASIQTLDGEPLVMNASGSLRAAVENALRVYHVHPRIVAQADSLEVVRMLVSCGFGKAVVPLEVMQEDAVRSGLSL